MASSLFGLLSLSFSDIFYWAFWLCVLYFLYKAYYFHLKRKQLLKNFSSFPGPETHWLYGNIHQLKQDGTDLDNMISYGRKFEYGYSLWFGRYLAALVVCHPEYARAILTRQDPKDDFAYYLITPWIGDNAAGSMRLYGRDGGWLSARIAQVSITEPCRVTCSGALSGRGLVILSGEKWYQRRKLLTPGFHYDVLKPYVKVMSDSVNVMLDKWEHLASETKSLELFHHVSLMTLDTLMQCAFSYKSNCQYDSESEYIKAVYQIADLINHRFRFFPYHNDLIFYLSPHGYRFRKVLRIVHGHTENVIKKRKESLKADSELEKIKQKRHLDFLDILLCAKDENGKGLSFEELRAEVDTFMFAGHDSTGSAISWILYCMGKYPEHQEKCREEIKELLGGQNSLEWEDLGKMPYTAMCIKECMRLYPPVPGIARQLNSTVTFPDGRTLAKDTMILLSIYAINRCPSIWEDPEVFDPLRFSPENSNGRHSYAFVPFSAGTRNCIGQNFAMNEIKVAIALTLQRFQVSPDPERVPKKLPQFVLRSINGIHVYLKKIPQKK